MDSELPSASFCDRFTRELTFLRKGEKDKKSTFFEDFSK
jgi:hypothetical protein